VPEVLRAKIKVFAELYRKTRELEHLNLELENRVRARTAELERSTAKLVESEQRRSMAIAAGKMGSWDWDGINGDWMWDEGQYRIFGVTPQSFELNSVNIMALLHRDDAERARQAIADFGRGATSYEAEFRINRPDGEERWCFGTAAATTDKAGHVIRVSGVTIDITERKRAEERQNLLTREVDHRAKNALTLAQSIVRLTKAESVQSYVSAVEGRISALARVHTILSLSSWQGAKMSRLVAEELAPYATGGQVAFGGVDLQLEPATAQTLALALHELVTNSAKYGALSARSGHLSIEWAIEDERLDLIWIETGGPLVRVPTARGFGTRSLMASVESQLGGCASFDWRPEGLICRLIVPLRPGATAPETTSSYATVASDGAKQRVAG
jgi:PAS domain S-box-containing protein